LKESSDGETLIAVGSRFVEQQRKKRLTKLVFILGTYKTDWLEE